MLWRIDVKADDVSTLFRELRIIGQLELPDLMQPGTVAPQDAMHRTDADRAHRSHGSRRPVGGFTQWPGQRQRQHALGDCITQWRTA